ncbi:transglutaminase-like domain-containing protein [Alkalibacter mobilis]|uniref:transglutaminase-like domain-containing protein n=1 Tax=Alkalibacter mobilis TaxID=2787712 RepID=UPI00189EC376|nr:transglutaminase domain-containing protein [Alkalibacter mobilis]MBF7095527.1 transglutaminase domain-containing protein [Alkalibacter mobilis]
MKKLTVIVIIFVILALGTGIIAMGMEQPNQADMINDEQVPLSSGAHQSYKSLDMDMNDEDARILNTESGQVQINSGLLSQGAVAIRFDYNGENKIKISVEKDHDQIYYNYLDNGKYEIFPLQFGNGNYEITLLENTTGKSYKVLERFDIRMEIEDENLVYLNSVQSVDWNYEDSSTKLALQLTEGMKSESEKFMAIYDYIVNNIQYDYDKIEALEYSYLPDNDAIMDAGRGICYDYSSLMASMLRSLGVPTKLVKGYGDFQPDVYHAWNEVLLDGKWYLVDTTYDAQLLSDGKKVEVIKDRNEYDVVYTY